MTRCEWGRNSCQADAVVQVIGLGAPAMLDHAADGTVPRDHFQLLCLDHALTDARIAGVPNADPTRGTHGGHAFLVLPITWDQPHDFVPDPDLAGGMFCAVCHRVRFAHHRAGSQGAQDDVRG